MNIAVSGSHGLIGSALVERLEGEGHTIHRLVRGPLGTTDDPREICWKPEEDAIEADKLEGLDAVVHLAGENIAGGSWTAEKKGRILHSRVRGTATLCRALAELEDRPHTLISSSAIGYYGDRGDEPLTEADGPGDTFLADVGKAWEEATAPAEEAGIRVVRVRTGVVLTPEGGALKRMLTPFKLGLGAKIGTGNQWMSWISLDDEIAALEHVLHMDSLRGAVNLVSPNPVTNAEFTKTLGRVVGRPTFLTAPAFAMKAMMGEMAENLLLASARCVPERLEGNGFEFQHPELEGALRAMLGR